jgi:hypothetical protein
MIYLKKNILYPKYSINEEKNIHPNYNLNLIHVLFRKGKLL